MDYKKSYSICVFGLWAGIIIAVWGLNLKNEMLGMIGIFIEVISLFQVFIFYKCPHCKKALSLKGRRRLEVCPECNGEL